MRARPLKRFASTTLWTKLMLSAMLFAGVSLKWSAIATSIVVVVIVVRHLRAGMREQYIMPPEEQYGYLWEDLVWNNTSWLNNETPEEGIKRLAGPYRDRSAS